ncbi:kinesin-related protein 8-like [Palaemon carinicauda]|uniref:kinesin-related protein 8-like n=1 Tax=Palaemon carinicauda TaxID=392227 RepID=UPI0035B628B3
MFSVPQTPISHSGTSGGSVRVYARTRPLLESESCKGAKSILKVLKEEKQMSVEDTNEKLFKFENVFDESTPQEDVYRIAVAPLVSKVAEGHNATVLAYGQTGSGKTFTMGTDPSVAKEDEGILQRAMFELLGTEGLDQNRPEKGQRCLTISFLEVYNEVIYDLLTLTRNPLKTKTGFGGAVSPVGMVEEEVTCVEEGLKLLERGSHNRSVASTALNQHSSRSHALIYVTVQNNGVSGCLILVDLAGAEGVGRAQTSGQQFTEGIHINKGLLTLGKVLSALSNPAPSYVPYRESVLTRLLKESLSGASHTAMIACVNPASYNLHETINTLRYAEQAQNIKTKPQVFSTIKRTGVKRRCEDVTATPGAWKRLTMMSDVKKSHNTTVSTPGHKPPRRVESKFNNTFATPSLRLNDVGINSSFLAPSIGIPLKQPIFEDDSPSRFSTVSTLENPEPHPPNLSPYMERISTKLEQSIMCHFESIEERVADRIISKLKSTKKSKSTRKSKSKLSGGNSNSSDSSDDSMSFITEALLGGKAGKKFFKMLGNVLKDTQSQVAEGLKSEKENKVFEKALNTRQPLCDVSNLMKSDTKTVENITMPHMNEELATCNILRDQPLTSTTFNSKRHVRKSTRLSTKRSLHNAIFEKVSPLCQRENYSPLMSFSKLDETTYKNNTTVVLNNNGSSPELCSKLPSESMKATCLEETMLYQEVLNLPGNSAAPKKDATFVFSASAISQSPLQIDRITKRKPARRSMRLSALKATQQNFEILTGTSPTTSLCKQKGEKSARLNATIQVAEDASPALSTTAVSKWKLVMSPRLQEDYYKEILDVLNSGTVRKLQSLPTIGPKTAMVLYNYRQMFGKFGAVEDIAKIPALPKSFYGRFMKANLMNRISFDI